jgi:hypothetical protein
MSLGGGGVNYENGEEKKGENVKVKERKGIEK